MEYTLKVQTATENRKAPYQTMIMANEGKQVSDGKFIFSEIEFRQFFA